MKFLYTGFVFIFLSAFMYIGKIIAVSIYLGGGMVNVDILQRRVTKSFSSLDVFIFIALVVGIAGVIKGLFFDNTKIEK